MIRVLLIVWLVAKTISSGRAVADDSASRGAAAAAFTAGMTAYDRGDFAMAIAAFEAAFRSDPRPELAFTLAQAHRNQYFADRDAVHLHRALGLYRHYLVESPDGRRATHARLHLETIDTILASLPTVVAPAADPTSPTQLLVTADAPGARGSIDGGAALAIPFVTDVTPGPHRVHLEAPGYDPAVIDALAVAERLVVVPATLRARPAELVVKTEDGAQITIDGRTVEATSKLSPGSHRVAITARGRVPVVRDIELGAGATQRLDVSLVPTARRRAARWTLFGAAGLGATSVLTGGIAWLAQRDALALRDTLAHPDDIDAYNAAARRRDSWRTVSLGLATTAGVAALTGVLLYYFDTPHAREIAPALSPVIGPESIGAGLAGTF